MKKKKWLIYGFLLAVVVCGALIYLCDNLIDRATKNKLYTDLESVPYNKVGLLLGTAKHLEGGYVNLYYSYRIKAASELFKAKKVKYIVISGDNGRKEYNEPEMMRSDLIKAGVDSTHIYLDYAGFRTFDSVVRLREIFSQTSVTIISQPFHNARAVYIASKEGIEAIGFNAQDVSINYGFKTQAREKLARVKVFVDYLFGAKPKFLGEKIQIPE